MCKAMGALLKCLRSITHYTLHLLRLLLMMICHQARTETRSLHAATKLLLESLKSCWWLQVACSLWLMPAVP
jgi:hypothetical protein